jgi:hypothetical protein
MSVASLPSLNLSLHRHKSVSSSSSNTNTNTLTSNPTNTTNIFLIPQAFDDSSAKSEITPPKTPKPPAIPSSRPGSVYPIEVIAEKPEVKDDLSLDDEVAPKPSPKDYVSMDFMKTLIKIQNEILLDNILLVNNLRELGDRVIYRDVDLKEMIEILMNISENEIDIRTEEVKKTSCGCTVPIYVKIKSITLRKTIPFLHTEIATRMQDEFKISLEYCVPT